MNLVGETFPHFPTDEEGKTEKGKDGENMERKGNKQSASKGLTCCM